MASMYVIRCTQPKNSPTVSTLQLGMQVQADDNFIQRFISFFSEKSEVRIRRRRTKYEIASSSSSSLKEKTKT